MQLKQTLIIAFTISLVSLTAWEFFWRSEGFYPTLDDNEALWAVQRNRIKRQMRAAAKQHLLSFLENTKNPHSYMLIYTGKKMPEWNKLTEDFKNLAKKVSSKKL